MVWPLLISPGAGLTVFIPSVSGDYIGETGATSFASGSVTWGASDDNLRSNAITFPGDFILEADVNDFGSAWSLGVYPISEDGTFNGSDSLGRGDMDLMTNSWFFNMTGSSTVVQVNHVSSQKTSFSAVDGDTFKIERVGSELKAYLDNVLKHTWTETSSAELRPCMGQNNQRGDLTNMTWSF